MPTWVNKLKSLLVAYLATDQGLYVITDTGAQIVLWDRSWTNLLKDATDWSG